MEMLISLLLLLGCAKVYSMEPSNRKSPHIVFMVADDLGWNDVSFHGSKQIPTPNIDALARDGIILGHYYVQSICSPSRASLMTGKYPIKIGFQHDLIVADAPWGLPLKEKILPQYLKDLNYATHAVGKWHLGFFKDEYLPDRRGFDSFFGYYTGVEDYYTHVSKKQDLAGLDLHKDEKNVWRYNGTYGSDLFTEKAKKIILEHNTSEPLFLYFPQQAPHSGNFINPLQAPKKYVDPMMGIDDEKRKVFAGMISSLDTSVGEIFEAMETAGILDDTIFVFTTDNGGIPQVDGTSGSNWPLKGIKHTLWEGGVRGVAFIWSSVLRRRSRIYNGLMHITDWLPTILSAVGSNDALKMLPQDIDGINQWPGIAYNSPSSRSEVLLNIDDIDEIEAIRKGRYKLVKGSYENGTFDKWYDAEGRDYSTSHSPRKHQNEVLYSENYVRFLGSSKAARILEHKYGRPPWLAGVCLSRTCIDNLEVQCGVPPLIPTCNATKEACLYDIIADPCEYYNIGPLFPEVIADLEKAIDKYRAVAIPPKDKPSDPAANPKYHGGAWVPWE